MTNIPAVWLNVEQTRILFSVFLLILITSAVYDLLRFQDITRSVARSIRSLISGALLALVIAGIGYGLLVNNAEDAARLVMSLLPQLVGMAVMFIGGYIWIRRYRYAPPLPRQDLVWKNRISGRFPRAMKPYLIGRRIFSGICIGFIFAAVSFLYFEMYARFFNPQYIEVAEEQFLQDQPIALVILFALLAPLTEELMFRWYLLHRLQHALRRVHWHRPLAVLLVSAVWSTGHAYLEPVLVKELQIFVFGLLLGWLFPRLGLEGCIAAHLMNNMVGLSSLAS